MGNTCCDHSGAIQAQIKDLEPNSLQLHEQKQNFFKKYPIIKQVLSDKTRIFQQSSNIKIKPFQNGIYIGEIVQGKKHGVGIFLYNEGFYYEGQWKDNNRQGMGRLVDFQGDCYEGQWKNDQPNEQGVYSSANPKRIYEGSWLNGHQNGYGIQYYQDGSYYQGYFVNGIKQGRGRLVHKDKTQYDGQFKNNEIHGYGIYKGKSHIYEGNWSKGKMNGTGKSQWFNKENKETPISVYIGQYDNGIKHGFGEYRWDNGQIYKGKWQNGQMKNTGVLIHAQGQSTQ